MGYVSYYSLSNMRTHTPIYILGINCSLHQSAAALIRDGMLIAAAEEERFSRKKFDSSFPEKAIAYCLAEAGIELRDVQYAGFYWQPWKGLAKRAWWLVRYFPVSLQTFWAGKKDRNRTAVFFQHFIVPVRLWLRGFRGRFYFIDHHLAHAASAFFVSPYNHAAICTVDFTGEHCTTSLAVGTGNQIRTIRRSFLPHSLGMMYAALTQFLGYEMNEDEYRVMGLAAYGQPKYLDAFRSMASFDNGKVRVDNSWFQFHLGGTLVYSDRWIDAFGPPSATQAMPSQGIYADVAASGQRALEEILVEIARWLKDTTSETRAVFAGGVALNASAIGRLQRAGIFESVWVQPNAHDPGTALGVCFAIWHTVLHMPRAFVMDHAYWGPRFSDEAIEEAIRAQNLDARQCDVAVEAAALLAQGKVVAWFQGRMEWGPRALGNRSILADPRVASMKDCLNEMIKHRESYRPFAPSVLREDASVYFDVTGESPFMSAVYNVRDTMRSRIPAVTHVDGTARIQTVAEGSNPLFWRLLQEFKKRTGESVLLNTSFNQSGEPIVCSPSDAVSCFLNSGIDALVMGTYMLVK